MLTTRMKWNLASAIYTIVIAVIMASVMFPPGERGRAGVLLVPVGLAGLPVVIARYQAVRIGAGVALACFCVISVMSVGMFLLPAAIMLLISVKGDRCRDGQ